MEIMKKRIEHNEGISASTRSRRRGVALLVVLLLVSITLGLSYAAIRSQTMQWKIHQNAKRRIADRISARPAALAGMMRAIDTMSGVYEDAQRVLVAWQGVGTTLSGNLNSHMNYTVSYVAGDALLTDGHADRDDLPYRVTIVSDGNALDPADSSLIATYRIEVVVQLTPRATYQEPSDWGEMQKYTVYQTRQFPFVFDLPCRFEGPIRAQWQFVTGFAYPNYYPAWQRYMIDLYKGPEELQPVGGPLHLPMAVQDPNFEIWALVEEKLVEFEDMAPAPAASDWVKPSSITSYQIYEGGPVYEVPRVSNTLDNVTLEPDVETNPLGIFFRDTSITIRNNVTIRGSLYCRDDIKIDGTNVHFESVDLPPRDGSDGGESAVRLPAASCRSFIVKSNASGDFKGLLAVFDEFKVDRGPDTTAFALTGRLIVGKLLVEAREPWNAYNWAALYNDFMTASSQNNDLLFHDWVEAIVGLNPEPRIRVETEDGAEGTPWSGTADIGSVDPVLNEGSDDQYLIDIKNLSLNTASPYIVPIGARFTVNSPGNYEVFTVIKTTENDDSGETETIEFGSTWGPPDLSANDEIKFFSPLPSAGTVRNYYHWYRPNNPIYVKYPGAAYLPADAGLRWELLQWTEFDNLNVKE